MVVHGEDGLDEVTLNGATLATETGSTGTRHWRWTAADFGLSPSPLDSLVVEGPQQSAEIIRGVLRGQRGPARDIVLANAAAALWIAGVADTLAAGARAAALAIDSRAAEDLLARLVELSHR